VDAQGRNIFSQADGTEAPALRHFLAGLQTHLPDLLLMFAPFINSFRRYVPGSQAPVNLHWGYDNRTTALRIPQGSPAARRVENRIAGADANPYLAIAASLAAGLAGLEAQQQPSEPITSNGYDQAHTLPRHFAQALSQMAGSASARALLGDTFVTGYCAVKALEHESFLNEISAWERRVLLPLV
jgi:glutamine synthetase